MLRRSSLCILVLVQTRHHAVMTRNVGVIKQLPAAPSPPSRRWIDLRGKAGHGGQRAVNRGFRVGASTNARVRVAHQPSSLCTIAIKEENDSDYEPFHGSFMVSRNIYYNGIFLPKLF